MNGKKKNETLICEPTSKKGNLFTCTLAIGAQSGKHLREPAKMILERKYFKERSTLHKALDALAVIFITAILLLIVYLIFPRHTPDYIVVDATVAPAEVITGGSSTLTFRYENQSKETLQNVRVTFDFPKHFKLDQILSDEGELVGQKTFLLGEIKPTEYGFLHVKGTMFGDVNGEQIFDTTFNYTYGDDQKDSKKLSHSFSPTASTLVLELRLPDHLVARQQVAGTIAYINTGDVDFPDLTVKPEWPAGFRLLASSPALKDGVFKVDAIKSGSEGEITFVGLLGSEEDTDFSFVPSFAFEDERYAQETLFDTIEILAPPVTIRYSIDESSIKPGRNITINLEYENTSEFTIFDLEFRFVSDLPVFDARVVKGGSYYKDGYQIGDPIKELKPGESGSRTLVIPTKRTLTRAQIGSGTNITVSTSLSANFNFEVDGQIVQSNTFATDFDIPLSSPIKLQSFGRYWTPSGDQIGRGPIPPYVGEATKYWIFWNISGTTNRLNNIVIEAPLGAGVTLTGRQSVSVGSKVTQVGNSVRWSLSAIDPTLPTNSTIAGAGFEVMITPTAAMIGKEPLLLGNAVISANDEFTGEVTTGASAAVTTKLYNDSKALQYGGVVEK